MNKNSKILIYLKKSEQQQQQQKLNWYIHTDGISTEHTLNDWTNLLLLTNDAAFKTAQPSSCWCKIKYSLRLMRM